MNPRIISILLIPFLLLTNSCKTTVRLSTINFNHIYNNELAEIKPAFSVIHNDNETSTIYFNIKTDDLHYVKRADDKNYNASVTLKINLLPSYNSNKLIDSVTVFIKDSLLFETGQYIYDSIIFNAPKGENYIMHIVVNDLNRINAFNYTYKVNKLNDYNLQNFRLLDKNNNTIPNSIISEASQITAYYKNDKTFTMNAHFYLVDQRPSMPPFVTYTDTISTLTPDSVFQVEFVSGIGTLPINKPGHYHFFYEDDIYNGFSLYYFHDDYPLITTHEAMVMPIRYLVSNNEYNELLRTHDLRSAIDRFWVIVAGDPVRAKSLVSRYYKNVQESNTYFTSYKEGWKTDRGMIYTIFGPPDMVYFSERSETWTYKDTWQMTGLEFVFVNQPSIYSENHYVLQRKGEYRNPWFLGIENWRK